MRWTAFVDFVYRKFAAASTRLRATWWRRIGRVRAMGKGCLIGSAVVVRGGQWIQLGSKISLTDHCWLNAVALDDSSHVRISIGTGSCLGRRCVLSAAESVILEERVLIGPNVLITNHNHTHGALGVAIMDLGVDAPRAVRIGRGAWLGANTVVLPGVSIGEFAVVGANSVVTRSVAAGTVVVGNPARQIR